MIAVSLHESKRYGQASTWYLSLQKCVSYVKVLSLDVMSAPVRWMRPLNGSPRTLSPKVCTCQCGESSCSYSNECIAEAAGYNVANDCVDAWPQLNNECPVGSGACVQIYAPITCGRSSYFYENECFADLAQLNVAEDCVAV